MSKSIEYTLYGDLEGMSVAELRAMLAEYPDDYRVDVRSRPVDDCNSYRPDDPGTLWPIDGWVSVDEDYFVIKAPEVAKAK